MRYMRSWNVGNSASQYGHFQLWNRDTAGGADVVMKRVGISTPSDAVFQIGWADTEAQHSISESVIGAGSDAGIDANGQPSPLGQLRLQVTGSMMSIGQLVDAHFKGGNYHGFDEFDGWHIPPQVGLVVRCGTPNIPFFVSWIWDEPDA